MKKILNYILLFTLLFCIQLAYVNAKTYSIDNQHEEYEQVPPLYYVLGTHMISDLTKIDYKELIAAANSSSEESPTLYQNLFGTWYDISGKPAALPNNNGLICITSLDGQALEDTTCTETTLKVTFENTTEEENPSYNIAVGEKLSATNIPTPETKRGKKFVCWIDKTKEQEYSGKDSCFDFSKPISSSVTLEPHYDDIIYTIKFDLNGLDSVDPNIKDITCTLDEIKEENERCKLPDSISATKKGYKFHGWSTVKDENFANEGTHFDPGDQMEDKLGDENNITLYAVWTPIEYTITYNLDGGTYQDQTTIKSQYTDVSKAGIELFTPSRTGYTFNGWEVKTDGAEEKGKGTVSETGDGTKKYTLSISDLGNITLIAKWEEKEYTITYDLDVEEPEAEELETPEQESCKFLSGCTLENAPERDDYDFVGWLDETDGYLYSPQVDYKGTDFADIVTLTAQWHAKNEPVYDIEYNLDGGNFEEAQTPITKFGAKDTDVSLPTPSKTGYTFKGWCTDEAKTSNCENITTIKAALGNSVEKLQNLNLYAKWEANTYTIKFYDSVMTVRNSLPSSRQLLSISEPQQLTEEQQVECTYDQTCNLKNHNSYFKEKKKKLLGWSLSSAEEDAKAYFSDGMNVKNLTAEAKGEVKLYAVTADIKYNITYYLEGGQFEHESEPVKTEFVEGETVTLPKATKEGYTFEGWYQLVDSKLADKKIDDGKEDNQITVNSDLILVAKWKATPEYILFIYLDGGTYTGEGDNPSGNKYKEGSKVTIKNPTREDKDFDKWVDQDGEEVTELKDESNELTMDSDKFIIATWKDKSE